MGDHDEKWWERRIRSNTDWPFALITLSMFVSAALVKRFVFPEAPSYVLFAMALVLTLVVAVWRLLRYGNGG